MSNEVTFEEMYRWWTSMPGRSGWSKWSIESIKEAYAEAHPPKVEAKDVWEEFHTIALEEPDIPGLGTQEYAIARWGKGLNRSTILMAEALAEVPQQGQRVSRLLILGGKASEEDLLVGKPWAGEDGEFLRRVVRALGFPEDEVVYRTVCATTYPTVEDVAAGSRALEVWLRSHPSVEVVCVFGKEAQRAMGVKGQTLRIAGIPLDYTLEGVGKRVLKVIPLAHPKYVLAHPAYATEWQSGWGAVRHLLDRGDGDWFEALGPVTFGEFPEIGETR